VKYPKALLASFLFAFVIVALLFLVDVVDVSRVVCVGLTMFINKG
jgi:hypothetical protein